MADDAVDLREYVGVLRRRLGLIVLVTVVMTGLAAAYTFTRVPVYTGRTSVLVQPASDTTQFRPDQLVSLDTEARIVRSAPVAQKALETLGWSTSVLQLLEHVEVKVTPNTLVLDVLHTDQNPRRAAEGANAFAEGYLQWKIDRSVAAVADKRQAIQARIDELEDQLEEVDSQIADAAAGSTQIQDLEQERSTITSQIAVFTSELVSSLPQTNPGEVILTASPPRAPSSPKHAINLAMGQFLGIFLGIVVAFIRDRTDDRIRGREGLEVAVDAPVLATIPRATGLEKRSAAWLVTKRQPRSPAAEAYRTLRTGIMALSRSRGLKVIAIASPTLGEGKSMTTANLAVVLSHADNRVLVMSADLRKPTLHQYFDLDIGPGLSDVLQGSASWADAVQVASEDLWVLTSGDPPVRPAELLQSQGMSDLFDAARDQFDFVLVDCPPVLGLADTLALAPLADAVILVARAESTKQGAIVHAAEQLEQVGAVVRGTVLNDAVVSKRTGVYGYGYGAAPDDEERGEEQARQRREQTAPALRVENGKPRSGAPSSGLPRRPEVTEEPVPAPQTEAASRAET
jgi:succinoglycan biosynthesis transport protein ExoP